MSDEDLDEELGIRPGVSIDSSKAVYVIERMLGEGGFGAVFLVHDEKNKDLHYAMKVEKKLDSRRHSKLKMEIAILKAVKEFKGKNDKDNARFMRHFTDIVDRGKKEKYFFLVMQLVGKSLADLKAARPDKIFSVGTGLGVAHQCLEAVEGLHGAGYIHRDLKPANYACGPGDKAHTVYILDFGIARMYKKKGSDGAALELKTPRQVVGFKGTVRFASLACHKNLEMGPKDDCESWFYLLLDLIVLNGLPWRKESDKKAVMKLKEDARNKKEVLYYKLKCPDELANTLKYLDGLLYADTVDYEFLFNQLKEAAKKSNVDMDALYDWEEGTISKSQMKSVL